MQRGKPCSIPSSAPRKPPPVSPLAASTSSLCSTSPGTSSPCSPRTPLSPTGKSSTPLAKFQPWVDANSIAGSPGTPSPSCTPQGPSLFRNFSLPSSTPPSLGNMAARSGSGAKEMILMWVQNQIKDYPIPMTNFSTCWNDGLAFCALIHVFYPDNFNWHDLDTKNRRHNFTLAFNKAEELADIYPLLDVEDMVRMKKPDWKCVFTYVQSFYRRFREGRSPPRKMPAPTGPIVEGQVKLSAVALAVAESQEAERKGQRIVAQVKGGESTATVTAKKIKETTDNSEEDMKDKKVSLGESISTGNQSSDIEDRKNIKCLTETENLAKIETELKIDSSMVNSSTENTPESKLVDNKEEAICEDLQTSDQSTAEEEYTRQNNVFISHTEITFSQTNTEESQPKTEQIEDLANEPISETITPCSGDNMIESKPETKEMEENINNLEDKQNNCSPSHPMPSCAPPLPISIE